MFLAIAALRDDSDYMQWFIINSDVPEKQDKWILCKRKNMKNYSKYKNHSSTFHKANVAELFEHFVLGMSITPFLQSYNSKIDDISNKEIDCISLREMIKVPILYEEIK